MKFILIGIFLFTNLAASNTKLFTTGTALTLIGSEFELTTNILYNDSELRVYFQDDWFVDECSNVKLPPISALVIYKNSFIVILNSRGKLGSKLKYSLSPECSFLIAGASATVNRNRARPKINAIFQMRK